MQKNDALNDKGRISRFFVFVLPFEQKKKTAGGGLLIHQSVMDAFFVFGTVRSVITAAASDIPASVNLPTARKGTGAC